MGSKFIDGKPFACVSFVDDALSMFQIVEHFVGSEKGQAAQFVFVDFRNVVMKFVFG